jgi:hypothetical protein
MSVPDPNLNAIGARLNPPQRSTHESDRAARRSDGVRRWAQLVVSIAAALAFICVAVAVGNPWSLPALLTLAWMLWPDRPHPLIELAHDWIRQRNQNQQQVGPHKGSSPHSGITVVER